MSALASESQTARATVELVRPMPGFPGTRLFEFEQLEAGGVLGKMSSLDTPGLSFLVVPAGEFFPDYAPTIDGTTVAELGLEKADGTLVMLVVRAGETLASTSVNLRAPMVINTVTGRGLQVILDDPDWPVDAPLAP